MRQVAKSIGGHYPTPDRVATFLRSWLVPGTGSGEIRVLDPDGSIECIIPFDESGTKL